MGTADGRRPRHRTVDRVAGILEAVASSGTGLSLTQLAVRLQAPVSSIQKLVNGLAAAGYLDEDDRRFVLGPAPHVLSMRAGRLPVHTVGHADLVELSGTTGTPVLLAVRVGDHAVYVDRAGTDEPFEYALSTALRSPLPRTAAGRVLLAQLDERDRRAVLATVMPDDTAGAVEVLEESHRIRDTGYAVVGSWHAMRGVAAVAVPVTEGGRVVAAVAAADRSERLLPRVQQCADQLAERAAEWARRAAPPEPGVPVGPVTRGR
jgi:DNA-binding IclR family transcriptional regulator